MGVTVEMQNTGDPVVRADVIAAIEHVLADRPGDWGFSSVGSQANDRWEMKITARMNLSDRTRSKVLRANTDRR
jgi:hypothetical protein